MKLVHRMLIFWISLWLACSGAMAGVMPISGLATPPAEHRLDCHEAANTDSSEHPGKHTEAHVQPNTQYMADNDQQPLPDSLCSHCRVCQMAASFLPTLIPTTASVLPVRDFALAPTAASPSFIPEPPQHIPLPVRSL
jgi:hypothetical protein